MLLWMCPGVLTTMLSEQQGLFYRMIHALGVGDSIKLMGLSRLSLSNRRPGVKQSHIDT